MTEGGRANVKNSNNILFLIDFLPIYGKINLLLQVNHSPNTEEASVTGSFRWKSSVIAL